MTQVATTTVSALTQMLGNVNIKKRFEEILGDESASFISSIISATKSNAKLAECDVNSIISSAVIAATLKLPIQGNLGFAAIVPYGKQAQFQMMWRGFVQLAIRTGQYENINATPVFAGELQKFNRITGEVVIDESKKTSDEIIGFVAYFKLKTGFEKYLYMNVGDVKKHGQKYSKSFSSATSQWQMNFPAMGTKTVLKMLISKFGILSIEMQEALKFDQATVTEKEGGEREIIYHDNVVDVDHTEVANENKATDKSTVGIGEGL